MASSSEDVESIDPSFIIFDQCIGCIEEIIMSEEFLKTQHHFLTKHCTVFDDMEENKLIYMDIFQDYAQLVETFLEQKLREMFPLFSMEEFVKELKSQPVQLEGEIFDILREFTDFLSFKAMMLDYKTGQNSDVLLLSGFKILK
ncbi:hypothetical protein DAPPUDRAFT_231806 [Daphnia pulex]|uniref:ADP-ribosylation factor-like protein 2-binding protein n=1 Tax=Daphnia pulex TaxID=6669 RepID=E9HN50_DAPPU|nr:hypothetical protein DAPPUDRAFT_231806 [Daphnia pulex]|eukprot:EFX66835.1 hypothetical protein DAPPUDRAFT_231806 [Daphnia pulex]